MRRTQQLYDGLFRCLCPALDEQTVRLLANYSAPRRTFSRPSMSRLGRRNVATSASVQEEATTNATPTTSIAQKNAATFHSLPSLANRSVSNIASQKPQFNWVEYLLRPSLPKLSPKHTPNDQVILALHILRNRDASAPQLPPGVNRHQRIVQLVHHLVIYQDMPLNVFIYECMMDAMVDPKGSANGIRRLLDDITKQGMTPTPVMCQSALEALVTHGDYLLRQEVISLMQRYWYPIDKAAAQNIALGLLRDGQYELALSKLVELVQGTEKVDLWVYDIFITVLGQMGYMDETLQLIYHRKHAKGTDDAFHSLLFNAMDMFSAAYHHDGTVFVWETAVKTGLFNPSNGTLDNVLATASRHGDSKLAAEIVEMLSKRGRVERYQYEALVEAFATAEDAASVTRTLVIMAQMSTVGRAATRSVYQMFKKNPALVDAQKAALAETAKEGQVPFEVVAVTIEAIAHTRGADAALDLYGKFFEMTSKRPDYSIMRDLIFSSTVPETTYMLAKDYALFTLSGNPQLEDGRLYTKIIPASTQFGDLDLAFLFADRIIKLEEGWHPGERAWRNRAWVQPLLEAGLQAQDERVWLLVDGLCSGKDAVATKTRATLQHFRMQKRAEDEGLRFE